MLWHQFTGSLVEPCLPSFGSDLGIFLGFCSWSQTVLIRDLTVSAQYLNVSELHILVLGRRCARCVSSYLHSLGYKHRLQTGSSGEGLGQLWKASLWQMCQGGFCLQQKDLQTPAEIMSTCDDPRAREGRVQPSTPWKGISACSSLAMGGDLLHG